MLCDIHNSLVNYLKTFDIDFADARKRALVEKQLVLRTFLRLWPVVWFSAGRFWPNNNYKTQRQECLPATLVALAIVVGCAVPGLFQKKQQHNHEYTVHLCVLC